MPERIQHTEFGFGVESELGHPTDYTGDDRRGAATNLALSDPKWVAIHGDDWSLLVRSLPNRLSVLALVRSPADVQPILSGLEARIPDLLVALGGE